MNAFLMAGTLAAVAGLLVFLTLHHFWIQPIWFILPPGLLIAGLGGLAVGWAYQELYAGLPPRPWTALAVIALIAVILLPAILLAERRGPIFDFEIRPGGAFLVPTREAVWIFVIDLGLTATLVGTAAGWWIAHTPRAALATGLAGLVFAAGPGHNIPFLGGTPATGKGILLLLAITVVSAVVLVESHHLLTRSY